MQQFCANVVCTHNLEAELCAPLSFVYVIRPVSIDAAQKVPGSLRYITIRLPLSHATCKGILLLTIFLDTSYLFQIQKIL